MALSNSTILISKGDPLSPLHSVSQLLPPRHQRTNSRYKQMPTKPYSQRKMQSKENLVYNDPLQTKESTSSVEQVREIRTFQLSNELQETSKINKQTERSKSKERSKEQVYSISSISLINKYQQYGSQYVKNLSDKKKDFSVNVSVNCSEFLGVQPEITPSISKTRSIDLNLKQEKEMIDFEKKYQAKCNEFDLLSSEFNKKCIELSEVKTNYYNLKTELDELKQKQLNQSVTTNQSELNTSSFVKDNNQQILPNQYELQLQTLEEKSSEIIQLKNQEIHDLKNQIFESSLEQKAQSNAIAALNKELAESVERIEKIQEESQFLKNQIQKFEQNQEQLNEQKIENEKLVNQMQELKVKQEEEKQKLKIQFCYANNSQLTKINNLKETIYFIKAQQTSVKNSLKQLMSKNQEEIISCQERIMQAIQSFSEIKEKQSQQSQIKVENKPKDNENNKVFEQQLKEKNELINIMKAKLTEQSEKLFLKQNISSALYILKEEHERLLSEIICQKEIENSEQKFELKEKLFKAELQLQKSIKISNQIKQSYNDLFEQLSQISSKSDTFYNKLSESEEKIKYLDQQLLIQVDQSEQFLKENLSLKDSQKTLSKELMEMQHLLKQEVGKVLEFHFSLEEQKITQNYKEEKISLLIDQITRLEAREQKEFRQIQQEARIEKRDNQLGDIYFELSEVLKQQLSKTVDENMQAEKSQQESFKRLQEELNCQMIEQQKLKVLVNEKNGQLIFETEKNKQIEEQKKQMKAMNERIKQLTLENINAETKTTKAEKQLLIVNKRFQEIQENYICLKEDCLRIIKNSVYVMKNEQQKLSFSIQKQLKQYAQDYGRKMQKICQVFNDLQIQHEEDLISQKFQLKIKHEYQLEQSLESEKLHYQELENQTRQQAAQNFQELNSQLTLLQKKLSSSEKDNQQLVYENDELLEQIKAQDSELYCLDTSLEYFRRTVDELLLESQSKFKKIVQPAGVSKELIYQQENYQLINILQAVTNKLQQLLNQNMDQLHNISKPGKNLQNTNHLIHLLTIQESEIGYEDEQQQKQVILQQQQQQQQEEQLQQQQQQFNEYNDISCERQDDLSIQSERQIKQIKKVGNRKCQIRNQSCLGFPQQNTKENTESSLNNNNHFCQTYSFYSRKNSARSVYNTSQI